jgi:pheromone shutdown protein TraB
LLLVLLQADPQVERILREAQDFPSAVEGMKNRAVARAMVRTMEEAVPGIARALIHERDEIMARALSRERGRIVGVVGLAHLDGIERHWERLTAPQQLNAS